MSDASKHIIDGISAFTVFGTLAQILPPLAALFTIIWTIIRIFETKTVQKLLNYVKTTNTK
jgi:hypothetical protein